MSTNPHHPPSGGNPYAPQGHRGHDPYDPRHHAGHQQPGLTYPPGYQQPSDKPRKVKPAWYRRAWIVGVAAFLVGIMLGSLGAGGTTGSGTAQEVLAATPGSCLRVIDMAGAGKTSGPEYQANAKDCRSKAGGAPAGGGGESTTVAEQPAEPAEPEGIGDGVYVVGEDIQPGTYKTAGPSSSLTNNCYWERQSGLSGEFGDLIANQNLQGPGVVTIEPGDAAFKSQGCKPWTLQ